MTRWGLGVTQPYDIGVLFVHGIGRQQRGDTLRDFADPLADSVGRWFGPASVTHQPCTTGPGEPDHSEITVDGDGRTLRVLVAEAWWAETFQMPPYGPLLAWLVTAVPFVVQRALDGGVRRTTAVIDERREERRGWGMLALAAGWRVVQNAVGVVLAFVLDVLLFIFGATQLGRVLPVRRTLLAYIGDSYALLRDETSAEAMTGRVRDSLHWLEARMGGAPIAVVAHSQGAELVRRVLAGRDAGAPLASLVTFGSGIEKLDAVRLLRASPWTSWAAYGLRVTSVAGVVFVALAVAGQVAPWWAPIGLGVALAALTAARSVLRSIVKGTYTSDRLGVSSQQVARWVDLYASRDPVPEGDLPLGGGLGVSSVIVNLRSLPFDHTSYQQNVEGFRGAVALELARIAGSRASVEVPAAVRRAERARAARVRLLVWTHRAIAAAAIGAWVLEGSHRVVVALVLAVAAAVLGVAVSALWTTWSSASTDALLRRRGAQS